MKKRLFTRLISLVLAAVMILGLCPAVTAAPAGLSWKKTDVDVSWDKTDRLVKRELHTMTAHKPTDQVRVSIVLEDASTLKKGYSTMAIGSNAEARAYDRNLRKVQDTVADAISTQALGGKELDVVWNLTLAANIISANVPYGKIDAIKAVEGVRNVVLENRYETETASVAPNMHSSAGMVGTPTVWQTGLTGAGTRIAIIDTGTDTDHQSFDNGAYLYALKQNAAAEGMSSEAYIDSLDLLDADGIASVLENLNAYERVGVDQASEYYVNEKLPFGANYVDYDLNVTHDFDNQGSHGSHVAGIAAANRYIPVGGSYADARQEVLMSGIAPDAQIITLKVFGYNPGPYDGDYFAAIEDAIWLGCDSVNLSLGSGAPGYSYNPLFAEMLDFLATTDTVVVMSAGNSGNWAENTAPQYLYSDGVSFHTGGSPGSYTNSLAVASVDNDGIVGQFFSVGGKMISYTENLAGSDGTQYRNQPMTTLDTSADGTGTEYEYIFIDGLGKTEDYKGMDLTGKVVFCQRGELSFYEKGNNAAALGAAAIVIYNNVEEAIGMDLTGYSYTAPCVSILQSEGAAVKAASTERKTADGDPYYTGKLTVFGKQISSSSNSEYYTMSVFSSWGVPGSLEMKPEITAPGGQIWSVNGVNPSGTAYELMSGTSMAAPHVTGMAALVAEYIRDNRLEEKTGLSVRHLTQSLLMSTAVPLREKASGGQYYSILNQGAGLARVDLATAAGSYVLVEGMPDGKVKVELGEDADREGVYSFSFSIHNMNGRAMSYVLSADLFTQDLFSDDDGNMYLDKWTRNLAADASFSVNGISLEEIEDGFVCDLNGDGATTGADADFLLEYLLGNETELKADGDLNGDGTVSSYDAHVLLSKLTGVYTANVPANGTVTVKVLLKLTEETREYLDAHYPAGAYIEGFVFARPVNDGEDVAHSIPVLGYYGSWTEPSMYDVGSYLEYTYESEPRVPYLYALNGIQSNYVTINYGDGTEYLFGGNPYTAEDEYLPQRNAINNKLGYMLHHLRFTPIRNAATTKLLLENAVTGEIYIDEEQGTTDGAYYHTNMGQWQNTTYRLPIGLNFAGIPEGTRMNLSLITAPELYCTYNEEKQAYDTDWDQLAEGAYLTTSFTIDNTAPTIKNVEIGENNTLRITAKDNEYIAAVALMNDSGTSMLAAAPANQTERGVEMTTELDLRYVFGEKFLVAVFDYAENQAVYEITLQLENNRPYFTAIDRSAIKDDKSVSYVGMEADGTVVKLANNEGRDIARAAEFVEGVVFEITDDNKLYVGRNDDLFAFTHLADLDPDDEHEMLGFNDLAYNRADGKLYGIFYSQKNNLSVPFLCTIDLYTGKMNVLGQMPIDANSMAIDGEGNFYSTIYGTDELYTYRSDVVTNRRITLVGKLDGYRCTNVNSMAWDHNTGELYWACTSNDTTNLLKVNTGNAKITFVNRFDFVCTGLFIAYESDSDLFAPTGKVRSVSVPETMSTLVNNTVRLTARVLPWNVSNDAVVWTTSNPGVATVDENGVVCGKSQGTAVITATSVLDKTKSASCTVTVTALDQELKGLVWDEAGNVHWASFNTDTIPEYKSLGIVEPSLPLNATMIADGTLYASTLDLSNGQSDLYTVDPETFRLTKVGGSYAAAYVDMTYAPSLGCGLAVYSGYILAIDLENGAYFGAWEWTKGLTSDLVGITYYGSQFNQNYDAWMDVFLILDREGNVYMDAFLRNAYDMGYFYGPEEGYIKTIGKPVDSSYYQGFYFDGQYTYWSRFHEADDVVELIAWDTEGNDNVYSLGHFAQGIWPVCGLYTDAEFSGANTLMDEKLATASIRSAELLTAIPTMELSAVAKGSLNAVGGTAPVTKPLSKGEVKENGDVEVLLTMPEDGTNGTMTVTYDPAKLKPVNAVGRTGAFAWKQVKAGEIAVAFADGKTLAMDDAIAALNFKAVSGGMTELNVIWAEFGLHELELAEKIVVKINPFNDVPEGEWYYDPVLWAVEKGVTTGATANTFNPGGQCQRAQVVTFLWRAAGSPEPTGKVNPFADVKESDFYYKAVLWAVEMGITNGLTENTFGPFALCNRAQVVTFLWRSRNQPTVTGVENPFKDVNANDWYGPAVLWAVKNGITNGLSAKEFGVGSICNRAQVVTFLYRTMTK